MRKLFVVALTSEVDLLSLKYNGFDIDVIQHCCFTGKKEDRGDVRARVIDKNNLNYNDLFYISNGDINVLFTGIGKINATYALTKYLCKTEKKPDIIYNIGTAGCCNDQIAVGDLVSCDRFIQLDMNATPQNIDEIGFTPYDDVGAVIYNKKLVMRKYCDTLSNVKVGNYICATMDTFNTVNTEYDIYDMEAFALAKVSLRFCIDFACIKYITDNILENKKKKTDEDWKMSLSDGRTKLTQLITIHG